MSWNDDAIKEYEMKIMWKYEQSLRVDNFWPFHTLYIVLIIDDAIYLRFFLNLSYSEERTSEEKDTCP